MGSKSKRRSPQTPPKHITPQERPAKSATLEVAAYKGPIPHPETLAAYDKITPGLADRILKMAEVESDHRRSLESQRLAAQIADRKAERTERRIGQVCAWTIGVITIGGGVWVASRGAELAGGLIGTGGVVALVVAFLKGRSNNETK